MAGETVNERIVKPPRSDSVRQQRSADHSNPLEAVPATVGGHDDIRSEDVAAGKNESAQACSPLCQNLVDRNYLEPESPNRSARLLEPPSSRRFFQRSGSCSRL